MPIRFRCEHCTQLLGIAHRKSGTTVACPNCQRPVVVPAPAGRDAAALAPAPAAPRPFEVSNFDDVFKDAPVLHGPPVVPAVAAPPAPRAAADAPVAARRPELPDVYQYDVEPYQPAAPPGPAAAAGLVLTPGALTILTVLGIILLGLAFLAGVIVGAWYLPA